MGILEEEMLPKSEVEKLPFAVELRKWVSADTTQLGSVDFQVRDGYLGLDFVSNSGVPISLILSCLRRSEPLLGIEAVLIERIPPKLKNQILEWIAVRNGEFECAFRLGLSQTREVILKLTLRNDQVPADSVPGLLTGYLNFVEHLHSEIELLKSP